MVELTERSQPRFGRDRLRLVVARGMWARLRGLLGRHRPPARVGLWLCPCRAVHTLGMRHAIAVAFIDHEGKVCRWIPKLSPGRCTGSRRAVAVIELPVGIVDEKEGGLAWIEAAVRRDIPAHRNLCSQEKRRRLWRFCSRIIK